MATAFRIGLGLALGAVAVAAYLVATAPRCYKLIALTPDLRVAVLFDECQGVVSMQQLPPTNLTPA